jgi:hypothetical protein
MGSLVDNSKSKLKLTQNTNSGITQVPIAASAPLNLSTAPVQHDIYNVEKSTAKVTQTELTELPSLPEQITAKKQAALNAKLGRFREIVVSQETTKSSFLNQPIAVCEPNFTLSSIVLSSIILSYFMK